MQDWYGETVLSQFANSPTIIQLLTNFNNYIDPTVNIDSFYNNFWNINTAVGNGLDRWGRIIGINRVLQIESGVFLGFQGPSGASGTGFNQGFFYNGQMLTTNYALLDDPYRALLLAKAMYNIGNGSIPAINAILIFLFGPGAQFEVAGGNSYCTDGENMTMTYTFPAALNPVQSSIVNLSGVLPKPVGVLSTVVT